MDTDNNEATPSKITLSIIPMLKFLISLKNNYVKLYYVTHVHIVQPS